MNVLGTLKIKYAKKSSNLELELELGGRELDVAKYLIDKMGECATLDVVKGIDEMESFIAAGYSAVGCEIEGLHNPESEYTKQDSLAGLFNETASTLDPVDLLNDEDTGTLYDKKQLWYICPCGNKGKHHIAPQRKYVTCHVCDEKMMVRPANESGPDYKDEYGNYFIAGEFRKTMKSIEEEKEFWDNYLIKN